jgi:hypothetical protein
MSTGFNAGLDSSDVIVRYGEEVTWDTVPAVAFQEVRLTGESFSEQKTRTRPEEIKADGFVSHALTTQVQASGGLNFALSFGTYDDLLGGLLNSDFAGELAINSTVTTGVITVHESGSTPLTNLTGSGFASNEAALFDNVVAGSWIRVSGYATNPTNNGLFRVTAVDTANVEIQVSETAGAGGANLIDAEVSTGSEVFIQGDNLRNGVSFRSYYFEKQLAAALFLVYSGSYINDGNLTAQVGGFLEGTFNFLCASEASGTATAGTGPAVLAPTGRVIDTVAGFSNLEQNDVAIAAVVQGISWTVTKNSARAQYGLGAANAQGMARGTIDVSGTMSVYFTDFTLYALYKAETDQIISFAALDDAGAGYIFTLPGATLMNPTIVAGGPDTDIVSDFELEGNEGTGDFVGVIMQIDKIPAAL